MGDRDRLIWKELVGHMWDGGTSARKIERDLRGEVPRGTIQRRLTEWKEEGFLAQVAGDQYVPKEEYASILEPQESMGQTHLKHAGVIEAAKKRLNLSTSLNKGEQQTQSTLDTPSQVAALQQHWDTLRSRILKPLLDQLPVIDECYRVRYCPDRGSLSMLIDGLLYTGEQKLIVEEDNLFSCLATYCPEVEDSMSKFKEVALAFNPLRLKLDDKLSGCELKKRNFLVEAAFHERSGHAVEEPHSRRIITINGSTDTPMYAEDPPRENELLIVHEGRINIEHTINVIDKTAFRESLANLISSNEFEQAWSCLDQLRSSRQQLVTLIKDAIDRPIPPSRGLCKHLA